jgi:hypothetical protein
MKPKEAERSVRSSRCTTAPLCRSRQHMANLYTLARTSLALVLLAIARAMSLLVGVVGIYGVLSYTVSQRTREVGIRFSSLPTNPGSFVWIVSSWPLSSRGLSWRVKPIATAASMRSKSDYGNGCSGAPIRTTERRAGRRIGLAWPLVQQYARRERCSYRQRRRAGKKRNQKPTFASQRRNADAPQRKTDTWDRSPQSPSVQRFRAADAPLGRAFSAR